MGGGGEETQISFPAVPIGKEIYVKASLFKNNSLVYSGKTEVIKVKKGDNRVKLALDKSYMVTFSWEGKTKQIEVKSGNLIPVSEIPEIYTPDGKAVVWYNGNNAFSFSNGINAELSLSSKVVDITAETVCDVIKTRYGDMEQLVKLQGNCSSDLVIKMGAALKENPNAKIILDLGDVTGLTEIPQEALAAKNALFGIILPKTGLTKIGNWALGALYNVKNIEIPASVTEIDKAAFQECISLESIVIPEGIAQISERTFSWCTNLETITIPVTVTTIGFESFNGCEALTTINYAGTKDLWDEIFIGDKNECLSNATINYGSISEIPTETVEVVASEAANTIAGLSGRNRVIVTGDCDSNTVSAIGNALRENYNAQILLDLSLVSELAEIPNQAFGNNSSLVEITLPESVTIGPSAFWACGSLKKVKMGENITSIPSWCFRSCSDLRSITIPESVTSIEDGAFMFCNKLSDIQIAGNNFVAVDGAIYTADRTALVAYPTARETVQILETVKTIRTGAFAGSKIKSITLPTSVTEIGGEVFKECIALESIVIPEGVTNILDSTFGFCRSLKSITIPATVTSIAGWAFNGCEALTTINYAGTKDLWEKISIGDNNECLSKATINYGSINEVPEIPTEPVEVAASEAADTIASLSGRNLVKVTGECDSNIVSEIGNALRNSGAQVLLDLSGVSGLNEIPQGCFRNSNSLVEITLPESVTTIERDAFSWCCSLQSINNMENIKTIQSYCFSYCENLQSITIPASVELIENGAFAGCSKLTNIVIEDGNNNYFAKTGAIYTEGGTSLVAYPSASGEITIDSSVSRIGNCAFIDSNITRLIIPATVTEIEGSAFIGCEYLETVDIQANIETIPSWAFARCQKLESITIPASVTTIEACAFLNCSSLTDITIESDIYKVVNNAIYTVDEKTLVVYPSARENVVIRETVTTIGAGAFAGSLVESITIPATVTTIEREAFRECELLYSISIPETVTSIGYYAFQQCRNLQTVEILANVSVIPQSMFAWSQNLTSVTIPATVTSIEGGAFNGCEALTTVNYAGTKDLWEKISIGDNNASLTSATIIYGDITEVPEIPVPEIRVEASAAANTIYNLSGRNRVIVEGECSSDTVSQIGYALRDNYNAQIFLDLSGVRELTEIPQVAFAYNSSLVEITLPDGIKTIGSDAFNQCRSLQSVYNLGTITTIPRSCFNYCENLQSITIPASVEFIENRAFAGCPKLTNIVIEEGNANFTVKEGAIYSTDGETLVAYPSASGEITIDSSVSRIGNCAFIDSNITSLIIPATVTEIEWDAFSSCEYLETVDIQANIETIPSWCFAWCSNLERITIPASVTSIESGAFISCNKLRDIEIEDGNNNYLAEDGAIYTTGKVTLVAYPTASGDVVIPNTVTTIETGAFAGSLIEGITLPDSLTEISNAVFHACTSLKSITIPESVTKISTEAFNCCSSLTSIVIPANVTTIENGVFHECRNLSSVTFVDENNWYVSENQDSGSAGTLVNVADSSYNAERLLGEYCYYYWTKVEE